jgi:hypothetical protein
LRKGIRKMEREINSKNSEIKIHDKEETIKMKFFTLDKERERETERERERQRERERD